MKARMRVLHRDGSVDGRQLLAVDDPQVLPGEGDTIRIIGTGEETDFEVIDVFWVFYPRTDKSGNVVLDEARITVTVDSIEYVEE